MRDPMHPRPALRVVLLASMALGSACRDNPTGSLPAETPEQVSQLGTLDDQIKVVPRFSIQLEGTGSFRPGANVDFTLRVTAPFGAAGAVIALAAPEIEVARQAGWGPAFVIPVRERIAPVAAWRAALSSSATGVYTATVQPQKAGYYRVVVTAADDQQSVAYDHGRVIDGMVAEEFWLHVSDTGGGLERTPDPTVYPAGSRRTSGPFRMARGQTPESGLSPLATNYGSYREVYYHPFDEMYLPVPYVLVEIDECDGFECRRHYTGGDADGYFTPGCPMSSTWYNVTVRLNDGSRVRMYGDPGAAIDGMSIGDTDCDPYTVVQLTATNSAMAHVYATMRTVAGNSWGFFGVARSMIEVRLGDSVNTYNPNNDIITIASVWGSYGVFAQAHEYGHALHHKALGGLFNYSCPNTWPGHNYDGEQTLGCALGEGFASYHSVAAMGPAADYYDAIEDNTMLDPGEDGSIVPHTVSAFFYDLTDDRAESHDAVTYPGSYVAAIIKTCDYRWSSLWFRENGVDHSIWCLARAVALATYSAGYFVTRSSQPNAQREQATEPANWSQAAIRGIWLQNLYPSGPFGSAVASNR
jgi:hypothetical protein